MLLSRIGVTLGLVGAMAPPATAVYAAEPSPQDVAFLKAAHQANLAVITAGQVAWKKTTSPEVKKLAATFMHDHIHLDAALAQTARELKVRLPNTPNEEQQALNERYEAAAAGQLDELYVSTQLAVQQEAHRLVSVQVDKGSEPAVKKIAEKASPIIAEHQRLLRDAA